MYTQKDFGIELKELLSTTSDLQVIAQWAYNNVYLKSIRKEKTVDDLALDLSAMEIGEDFTYTLEELSAFADKLSQGEKSNLLLERMS
jgi:hypothetical protein